MWLAALVIAGCRTEIAKVAPTAPRLDAAPSLAGDLSADAGAASSFTVDASAAAEASAEAEVLRVDGGIASLSDRAEACLASPTCPAAEAARLFVAAADAHDPKLDCFRFLDGAGTRRDPARGRACLERSGDALDCGGSSMSLESAELALMRIDGVGGNVDIGGARRLVEKCFDDATGQAILQHAAAKEDDAGTPRADFCKDIGGTTITVNECEMRGNANSDTRLALQAKTIVLGLDPAGRELFAKSDAAFARYVAAAGDYVYEVYFDGSVRNAMALTAKNDLKAVRSKDLAAFSRFVAKDTSPAEVLAAEKRRAAAVRHLHTDTARQKAALRKAEQAWEVFRDAEVAFYAFVIGPAQGAPRVAAAVRVRLAGWKVSDYLPD